MRVLVTGSAGRVGSRLVEELTHRGHSVISVDVKEPNSINCEYEHVNISISDPSLANKLPQDIEAVIHLSAILSWNENDTEKVFESNVIGTHVLLSAVKDIPLTRFVLASSGEVYPENKPEYLPLDENHPRQPISFYGTTKLLCEEMLMYHMRKYGTPGVAIRMSHTQSASELLDANSFFSGARFFLKKKIERARKLGQTEIVKFLSQYDRSDDQLVISRGQDGRPFRMHITDTRDIVQGFVLALEKDGAVGEVFNLGSDEPVRFDEAIPLMSNLIGMPYIDVTLPIPAIDYVTSNEKAKRILGFRPQFSFRDMLTEAATSFQNKK